MGKRQQAASATVKSLLEEFIRFCFEKKKGVNLQTTCSPGLNVWRYSTGREQKLKAQFIISVRMETLFLVVDAFLFILNKPCGALSAGQMRPLCSKRSFCFFILICFLGLDKWPVRFALAGADTIPTYRKDS